MRLVQFFAKRTPVLLVDSEENSEKVNEECDTVAGVVCLVF